MLVVGLDILDQEGNGVDPLGDPAFTCDLLKLKINQGGGGFRPYRERINFLNCIKSTLPQMLDRTLTGGAVKQGLRSSLSDWIGAGSFKECNKEPR